MPDVRDTLGYWDWENPYGTRYRVTIQPPNITQLTPTLEPEWGEMPAPGSNFHRLPDGALAIGQADPQADGTGFSAGAAKFSDGLPWGLVETASYTLQVRPDAMQSNVTDQAFAGFLIDYLYEAQGTIYTGPGSARTFDLPTRVIVDVGTASDAIADFTTRFDGAMRTVPTQKWTVTPKYGAVVDLELDHIAKLVLDTVRMSDVAARVLSYDYESEFPAAAISPDRGTSGTGFERAYDAVWHSASHLYAWMFEPVDQRVCAYHRAHLMHAAQICVNEVYCWFTRQSSATLYMRFASASYDAPDYGATPWDHWTLYEQSIDDTPDPDLLTTPNAANIRGDAFGARWARFIGTVALDDDPDEFVAGLLIEGDQSLHSFPTLWDFLVEVCDEAAVKGVVTTPAGGECTIAFRRLREVDSTTTLTIDDFRSRTDPSSPPDAIDMEVGAAAVLSVDATVRQSFGDDNGTYRTSEGAQSEGGVPIKCVFDTMPVVGPSEWKLEEQTEDWSIGGGGFSRFAAANLRQWPFWKLWYTKASVFGSTNRLLLRAHDSVTIDDGASSTDYGNDATPLRNFVGGMLHAGLPMMTTIGSEFTTDEAWRGLIDPTRKCWLVRQRESSSHRAAAVHAMARFGASRKPVTIKGTVSASLLSIGMLGDTIRIGPSPYVASNILATGADYLDSLSSEGDLVSITVDDVTGLADIEIVTGDTA